MNIARQRSAREDHSDLRAEATGTEDTRPLFKETVVQVYRQMRTLAGPSSDLDDLVQAALEQVVKADFRQECSWSTFTRSICYRVWLKHLRWRYRFRAQFVEDGGLVDAASTPLTPAELVQDRQRYARLYSALARVSLKRRAVVTLHDIDGLDVPTIAAIVDAKPSTVRSRLRDGRKRLGELLKNDPYFSVEER